MFVKRAKVVEEQMKDIPSDMLPVGTIGRLKTNDRKFNVLVIRVTGHLLTLERSQDSGFGTLIPVSSDIPVRPLPSGVRVVLEEVGEPREIEGENK